MRPGPSGPSASASLPPRELVPKPVDHADTRPDGLVKQLGVRRAGVRAGWRQLLGILDLLPQIDELLAWDVSSELGELLRLLVRRVVAELCLQLLDRPHEGRIRGVDALDLLHEQDDLVVLLLVVLDLLGTVRDVLLDR